MSRRVRSHLDSLTVLSRAKPRLIKSIIRESPPSLIHAICECGKNLLNGNVKISNAQKRKLKRYKRGLRTITTKSVSLPVKRRVIQKGGFLGAILGAVLPALASILGLSK